MALIDVTGVGPLPRRAHRRSLPAQLTPFHTAVWGRAWSQVTTEAVGGFRLMQWPLSDRTHHLPYYLVDRSPLWEALEGDAGLVDPEHPGRSAVWRGRPVTYARSLYGEYGGLPGAPDVVLAEAVDRGVALAAEWDTAGLVVGNLTTEEAITWGAVREPAAAVTLYWAHRTPVPAEADGFIDQAADAGQRKARRELRRQWNRGNDAGLSLAVLEGPVMEPAIPRLAALAAATSLQHGPALYGPDILAAAAEVPGAVALVAMHGREIAGGFVCFRTADTLYLWTAAIDLSARTSLHTYAWLMWESVRHAAVHGIGTIDAGRGNYRYKHRLGLTVQPLTSLIYLLSDDPGLRDRFAAMHTGLQRHAEAAWLPA